MRSTKAKEGSVRCEGGKRGDTLGARLGQSPFGGGTLLRIGGPMERLIAPVMVEEPDDGLTVPFKKATRPSNSLVAGRSEGDLSGTLSLPGKTRMHEAALQSLHAESYGWALCCCGRDRSRAEDVLQRVYVKVLSGQAHHAGNGSFRTWLFAVIRRTALEDGRREWGRRLMLSRWWQRGGERETGGRLEVRLPSEASEAVELREAFSGALAALPGRQREVLHLVFYQGLSIAQAAEVMGISVGSARTHYERGKKSLRARLAPFCESWELSHVQPIT